MLKLKLAIALCIISLYAAANPIDSLKSDADVLHFVQKQDKVLGGQLHFSVFPADEQRRLDSLGIKNWYTCDLNNDGQTDLIAANNGAGNSMPFIAVVSKGNGFKTLKAWYEIAEKSQYVKAISIGNSAGVAVYDFKNAHVDTLVLWDEYFISYCAKPKNYTIQSIQFSTTACYGSCPVFAITIDSTGQLTLTEKQYSVEQKQVLGEYHKTLSTTEWAKLKAFLNYIDIANTKPYMGIIMDAQRCFVEVKYDNTTRVFKDYPGNSSANLDALYNILYTYHNSMVPKRKLKRWHKKYWAT